MFGRFPLIRSAGVIACIAGAAGFARGAVPPGFTDELVSSDFQLATGIVFDANGRGYVWEKAGRVWTIDEGVKSAQPLLDISEEVRDHYDYGLLGFALHPDFLTNGYYYVLYAVDSHHLRFFGTQSYDPDANDFARDSIGRLTRYTADPATSFTTTIPNSRLVLLGESASTGVPLCHQTHGIGTVLFADDGSLLVSTGDGASFLALDTGGPQVGSSNTALADGILRPAEDVGAYRSQLLNSHSGKVLRLDPNSGDGLPDNPFFDALAPRSPRSRTYALGLRNPFRFTVRPGTADPHNGFPGVIYLGDVGWDSWEELNVITGPGRNFGWPAFEGLEAHAAYTNAAPTNLDAPNPLAAEPGCDDFFRFSDLIVQDSLNPATFPNPCDPQQDIPSSAPTFMHTRPALDWGHMANSARCPVYDSFGNAAVAYVGANGSPVSGPQFGGYSSTGGVWYTHTAFPQDWRNTYFHADWGATWIRVFDFDENDRPSRVRNFHGGQWVVCLAVDPASGALHYVTIDNNGASTVRRIRFTGNAPPVAVAAANPAYGTLPLSVAFSSAGSSDPEGGALTFRWNFGDGSPESTLAHPVHVYAAGPSGPVTYTASLTVRDPQNNASTTQVTVHANNTPPVVAITSPPDGSLYRMGADFSLNLRAAASDAEHGPEELACAWQVFLHHNDHSHPLDASSDCEPSVTLTPYGCVTEDYFYELRLTVTDAGGLATTASSFMYPNCCAADWNNDGTLDAFDYDDYISAYFDYVNNAAGFPDYNTDGYVDAFDYDDFVSAFFTGC